jgi:serine/threonine protein phosphatase PrpC
MTIRGEASGTHAVCDQREWEQIERDHPGYHKLVQSGITNEGEAERLARAATKAPKAAVSAPARLIAEEDDADEPLLVFP